MIWRVGKVYSTVRSDSECAIIRLHDYTIQNGYVTATSENFVITWEDDSIPLETNKNGGGKGFNKK